jgi:hypothetical protein
MEQTKQRKKNRFHPEASSRPQAFNLALFSANTLFKEFAVLASFSYPQLLIDNVSASASPTLVFSDKDEHADISTR